MDDSTPSKRIMRVRDCMSKFWSQCGSMTKSIQVLDEKSIAELRSKKKNDPIALQQVINNAKASDSKIVEGGCKRKAKANDSQEIVSASSDLDKFKEHHVFA
ncbi:hypothetical protein H5410_064722 [Solanum commersonii]|uniref:Uncharacterized protein n=1 Tax=Solanum commersonii TaxID=4109 RepID=A0A9J5VYW6_SOLCO|nr:hypothetical protein H5410_064722 [Solanum commersonii]